MTFTCFPPNVNVRICAPHKGGRCVAVRSLSKNSFYQRFQREIQVRSPKASAKVDTFKLTTKYLQHFLKENL